jgi:hypothetical protein
VAHVEEMGWRASGEALVGEIEMGPKGSREES